MMVATPLQLHCNGPARSTPLVRSAYPPPSVAAPAPGVDPAAVRQRIETLERVLERSIALPVVGRRIGLDAIAGLVPVAGDVLSAAVGLYLVWEARRLGLSRGKLARMIANVGIDAALGAVPVVGDLFDFAFRSNSRNLRLVRRHLDRHHPVGKRDSAGTPSTSRV